MIVYVKLNDVGKLYCFNDNGINLHNGDNVIVKTDKGLEYGMVMKVSNSKKNIDSLNIVFRKATEDDVKKNACNINDACFALKKCRNLVKKYKLNMKVIDSYYTFNREQLMFRFVSDERVDFRNLAKELGSTFKTRIELRQVGIRDKAKVVGGIGPCGRLLCCSTFLQDFDSVSINMAKNQQLALNPTKINGVCGRLLCCLTYENDNYYEYKKGLPNIGSKIVINSIEYRVLSIDIFNKKLRLYNEDEGVVELDWNKYDSKK